MAIALGTIFLRKQGRAVLGLFSPEHPSLSPKPSHTFRSRIRRRASVMLVTIASGAIFLRKQGRAVLGLFSPEHPSLSQKPSHTFRSRIRRRASVMLMAIALGTIFNDAFRFKSPM